MLRRHISFGFHKPLTYLIIEVGIFSAYLTGVPNPDTPAFAVLARCDVSDICDFELLPIVPDNPQWHELPIRTKVGHYFDILLTYSRCPIRTGYIAKKEMLSIPLLRTWMKRLYCLFLDRENPKEGLKTILTGIDYLKAGTSIVIFPEGTRNKSIDGVLPFHAGSFKLAEKSGCSIIPMVQNNTAAALEDHLPFFKKTHTVLEFGKPIDVASMDREQKKTLAKDVQDLIEKMYEENKALV